MRTPIGKANLVLNEQDILLLQQGFWDQDKRKISPTEDPGHENSFQGVPALPRVQS